MLVPLLLSLLLDGSAQERRGSLAEAKGRLGLGHALVQTGAKGRMDAIQAWIMRQPEPRQKLLINLLWVFTRLLGPDGARLDLTSTAPRNTDPLVTWVWLQVRDDDAWLSEPIVRWMDRMSWIRDWYVATRPDIDRLSLAQASDIAEQWHQGLMVAEESAQAVPNARFVLPDDPAHPLPPGWTWQVFGRGEEEALRKEGKSMGNCLAEGGYEDDIEAGKHFVFSLRKPPVNPGGPTVPVVDVSMELKLPDIEPSPRISPPHAIKLVGQGRCSATFVEIKGRNNAPVAPRYRQHTLDLVRSLTPWADAYLQNAYDCWALFRPTDPEWRFFWSAGGYSPFGLSLSPTGTFAPGAPPIAGKANLVHKAIMNIRSRDPELVRDRFGGADNVKKALSLVEEWCEPVEVLGMVMGCFGDLDLRQDEELWNTATTAMGRLIMSPSGTGSVLGFFRGKNKDPGLPLRLALRAQFLESQKARLHRALMLGQILMESSTSLATLSPEERGEVIETISVFSDLSYQFSMKPGLDLSDEELALLIQGVALRARAKEGGVQISLSAFLGTLSRLDAGRLQRVRDLLPEACVDNLVARAGAGMVPASVEEPPRIWGRGADALGESLGALWDKGFISHTWIGVKPETALLMGLSLGPRDDLRFIAARDPVCSFLYALHVDQQPHPVTRRGCSASITTILKYAQLINHGPGSWTSQDIKTALGPGGSVRAVCLADYYRTVAGGELSWFTAIPGETGPDGLADAARQLCWSKGYEPAAVERRMLELICEDLASTVEDLQWLAAQLQIPAKSQIVCWLELPSPNTESVQMWYWNRRELPPMDDGELCAGQRLPLICWSGGSWRIKHIGNTAPLGTSTDLERLQRGGFLDDRPGIRPWLVNASTVTPWFIHARLIVPASCRWPPRNHPWNRHLVTWVGKSNDWLPQLLPPSTSSETNPEYVLGNGRYVLRQWVVGRALRCLRQGQVKTFAGESMILISPWEASVLPSGPDGQDEVHTVRWGTLMAPPWLVRLQRDEHGRAVSASIDGDNLSRMIGEGELKPIPSPLLP